MTKQLLCGYCERPLPPQATGRPRHYCGGRCRSAASRRRNAPSIAEQRAIMADRIRGLSHPGLDAALSTLDRHDLGVLARAVSVCEIATRATQGDK